MKINQTLNFIIKAITVVATLIGLLACEKENCTRFKDQDIYFEHYAINYAWGLSYVHWVIDGEGNVRINCKADSIIWINENEINESIFSFDSVIYKVDLKELRYYINFIPSASKGKIRCDDRDRADFGGIVYNAFYLDNIVLLSSMSDIEDCSNKNYDAIKIDNWLKKIHYEIYLKN